MPRFIARRALLIASAILPMLALAQTDAEPKLPAMMKIVVPFGAGASNDAIARAVAPLLARRLGNTVIVENKPGAAGVIGSDYVAKSPADGSVLLLSSSTFVTAAVTQPRLPYDPLTAFVPVSMVGNGPMLLAVSAATPIKSAAELVAAAKAKPGSLTYGTSGTGSIAHLASEMLSDAAGIRMTHVPYKGAAEIAVDLIGGRVDLSSDVTMLQYVKQGKAKLLATASRKRLADFPDVPTLAESGVPDPRSTGTWFGAFAPKGTPAPVIDKLAAAFERALKNPDVIARMQPYAMSPAFAGPAAFEKQWASDYELYGKTIRELDLKLEN